MSVVKSKRSESVLEFLHTARELQIYTIRKCTNAIPKRYTFYLGVGIAESAKEIYRGVKRGNSIYPTNQHEAQLRRDCFIGAYAELENLASQVEVAQEIIGLDPRILKEWAELITREMRLIKAVLKADRERYKNLI